MYMYHYLLNLEGCGCLIKPAKLPKCVQNSGTAPSLNKQDHEDWINTNNEPPFLALTFKAQFVNILTIKTTFDFFHFCRWVLLTRQLDEQC